MGLSLAVTADLHWGHRRGGDETRALADFLHGRTPDVLVLAGDLGTGPFFPECLGMFADLPCRKVLVPGNHDLWVRPDDDFDSLQMYERELPHMSAELGFHYLDVGPLLLPEADLALVGSINWYDYSWGLAALRAQYPEDEHRLQSKRFPRGRHNDANFVRWTLDDVAFTSRVVAALERQLDEALDAVGRAIVVTHHPPFYGLGFPHHAPPEGLESILWDAFCGNQAMEDVLARRADRVAFTFCGHTHRQRESMLGAIRGFNIGSDYHFKRLLWLDWPEGTIQAHQFGDPTATGQ
jgi:predicted phosphohydrolase